MAKPKIFTLWTFTKGLLTPALDCTHIHCPGFSSKKDKGRGRVQKGTENVGDNRNSSRLSTTVPSFHADTPMMQPGIADITLALPSRPEGSPYAGCEISHDRTQCCCSTTLFGCISVSGEDLSLRAASLCWAHHVQHLHLPPGQVLES